MCGRYVVAKTLMASMPALFEDVGGWEPDLENFNMTPGTDVPIASLSLTLAAVLISGLVWIYLATRVALRGRLAGALVNE